MGRLWETARRWMRHDPLVVGVIAAVVTAGNTVLLGFSLSPELLMAAFAGATLVYWADRVLGFSPEDEHAHPDRIVWVQTYRRWLYVEGVSLAVMLAASLPRLGVWTLVVAAVCGGLAVVHVLPVLPGRRRMKAVGRGQAVIIAFAWAAGSVLLPWAEAGGGDRLLPGVHEIAVSGVFLAQFLVVYANVVVAGWSDRRADERAGIPVEKARPGVMMRRYAARWAVAGGFLILALGTTILPMTLAMSYAAGVFGLTVLLIHLRPRKKRHHMLWLDLAVALPGMLVLLSN